MYILDSDFYEILFLLYCFLRIKSFQQRKNSIYKIPEDVNTFGAEQQQQAVDGWSLAGHIQRVLANDAEYMPYFLALLVFTFCAMTFISQYSQYFLARVLVYGILFTIGRYIHTISYLIGNIYGRILGFLITVIVLFVTSIDHVYYITKGLYNLKPNP
ncbi:unnamed protein product [Adineta steineri]|uniref:Uncharacterized protein n=1 Tax=Adineta steineri TaxID=433720 RepID=A0A819RCC5_9BILA|nr:unnamed protein product [Adineta steineri]